MGLFSTSPPPASHTNPAPSKDGAYEAPNRTARDHCWHARDQFFACLDVHGIVDSIKEKDKAAQVCGVEEVALQRECAASWVTYFKQRRVMEYRKKQTLEGLAKEGAKPMPEGMNPSGVQGGTQGKSVS